MKRRQSVAWLVCLAGLLPPALAAAQPGRSAVTAGNRHYAEGRFEEAHEQYLEALRAAPDSPIVPFNNGNALYRTDEFQRAMEAYRQAADSGDPAVEGQAWYNLGNAFFRQQQLEPALEAYKQALRRNPADVDAKHNLELALEQLQQQQPSDQPRDQDGDENEENQDQEQPDQNQQNEQGQQQPEQNQQGEQGQQQQDPSEGQPDPSDAEPPDGEQPAEPQPQPGELSREDAERLLEAINEDPDRIQRRRRTVRPARPPRRPW